jgi:hypothetical protein
MAPTGRAELRLTPRLQAALPGAYAEIVSRSVGQASANDG